MNANPWAAPKSREIRRVLVSLDERIAQACDIVPDEGDDPHASPSPAGGERRPLSVNSFKARP